MNNYTYMSLFSNNDYLYAIIALMYSWKNTHSKYPYYLLVTKNISTNNKKIAKSLGFKLIEIEEGQPVTYKEMRKKLQVPQDFGDGHGKNPEDRGGQHTFSKFKAFDLVQFDKILLIDCDILFIHNIDYVFDYPCLASVSGQPGNFCSGCLLIEPRHETYQALVDFSNQYDKTNQGMPYDDYMILKDFFGNIVLFDNHLFPTGTFYNLFSCNTDNKKGISEGTTINCIHMTGRNKPGLCGKKEVINGPETWYFAKMMYIYYIDILNFGITDLNQKGITNLSLV